MLQYRAMATFCVVYDNGINQKVIADYYNKEGAIFVFYRQGAETLRVGTDGLNHIAEYDGPELLKPIDISSEIA